MKKVLLLLFFTLFLFSSCDVNEENNTVGSLSVGSLTIYISNEIDRIIEPDFDDEIYSYSVFITNIKTSEVELLQNITDDVIHLNDLKAGEYDIYVVSKNVNGIELSSNLLKSYYVTAGENNTANIVLEPIRGEGSLNISIEWSGDLETVESFEILLESVDGLVLDELDFEIVGNRIIITESGIESGYYIFHFFIMTNLFGYTDAVAVRIINNETTAYDFIVPDTSYFH